MTQIDDEPMYDSMDAFALAKRRENDVRAAEMTRTIIARLAADGLSVAPGVEEALTCRTVKLLNERLEQDVAAIAVRMAAEAERPEATGLLH